jgi:hypothetical protein
MDGIYLIQQMYKYWVVLNTVINFALHKVGEFLE